MNDPIFGEVKTVFDTPVEAPAPAVKIPTFEVRFSETSDVMTITIDLKTLADHKDIGTALLFGKLHEFAGQGIHMIKIIQEREKKNGK